MQIDYKPFWQPWLIELLKETYEPMTRKFMENSGDIKELNSLTEEQYKSFEQCRTEMYKLYDSGEGAMTIEEMQTHRGPHISRKLHRIQPMNGFRAVWRSLYNTLEIWVWG